MVRVRIELWYRLDALICTLADIADRALEANYLLSMIDLKFVSILHLFCDLLGKVHGVSTVYHVAVTDC
jgi:hypothetical protein